MARTSAKDKENVVEEVTTTSVTTAENEELKALREENARLKKQLKEKEETPAVNVTNDEVAIDCNGKKFTPRNDGGDELRRRGLSEEVVQNELELQKEVTIILPKDPFKDVDVRLYDPLKNITIAIQRGVPVRVPGYIAKSLERSQNADIVTAEMMNKMSNEFAEQEKEYNN
jgi:hypothetical protein